MKKMLVVLMALVAVLCAFAVVSADNDGYATWCNIDEYGCYVNEDDAKCYIQFWSEEARDYIMGKGSDAVVSAKVSGDKMALDQFYAGGNFSKADWELVSEWEGGVHVIALRP